MLTSVLEEEPVVALPSFSAPFWKRQLVLGIVSIDQVLQYATAFKDMNWLAVIERISDCRYPSIGVDL